MSDDYGRLNPDELWSLQDEADLKYAEDRGGSCRPECEYPHCVSESVRWTGGYAFCADHADEWDDLQSGDPTSDTGNDAAYWYERAQRLDRERIDWKRWCEEREAELDVAHMFTRRLLDFWHIETSGDKPCWLLECGVADDRIDVEPMTDAERAWLDRVGGVNDVDTEFSS